MPKISAGLLMYRIRNKCLEVFIVHPGGPFWKDKDIGAWSIPKGEVEEGEGLLERAKKELEEETGIKPPFSDESFIYLGEVKQKSGKIVHAWAFEGDWNGFLMRQSFTEIEYPKGSGKKVKIPEVDKAAFFNSEEAKLKLNPAQAEFIDRLKNLLEKNKK